MLEFLRIQNLALIDDLELEFSTGLNALTGETGAGKSFILRAVNFLTGDKLTRDFIRAGAEKAVVEAVFVNGGEEMILRRELSADTGRSRLFVNDRLSSVETVARLKDGLFLHTSQHGQQKLLQPAYQAEILDYFVPEKSLFEDRETLLAKLKDILDRKEALAERSRELASQRDFLEFQQKEIGKVNPAPGEEDELEARRQTLRNSQQVTDAIENARAALHGQEGGLMEGVADLARQVAVLAEYFPEYEEEAEALVEFKDRLFDLDSRLRRQTVAEDGDDLEAIESRLYALSQLRRKLGRSLEEIVHLAAEIEENLSFLDSCALDMKTLEKEEAAAAKELAALVGRLNAARRKASAALCEALRKELVQLGFSEYVQVEVDFRPKELYPGINEDRARIMWVPNPGQKPQPLDRIASGGELSRFLLALTGLIAEESLPTLIFDEVDAGVGGLTLNAVAERLKELSERQQMILITHWPQLAARADRHFTVVKSVEDGRTTTRCGRLGDKEIFAELSRMAGGGDQGRAMAEKLLAG